MAKTLLEVLSEITKKHAAMTQSNNEWPYMFRGEPMSYERWKREIADYKDGKKTVSVDDDD